VVHQTSVSHGVLLLERRKLVVQVYQLGIDDHTHGNHSSSFTWDSLSNLFCPKLSNNVRWPYNGRHACFINIIHSISSKFPRFKCTFIIVKNLISFVLLKAVAMNRLVFSGLQSLQFLHLFIKPCNQSMPAILLSFHLLGNLHPGILP